jgi:RsiW-degrading membrane proteinase PrsW (M82 family)
VALLTPLIVLLGHWVSDLPWLAWLLLPPFHILALGLPILWLLWFGRRGLSRLTPRRVWGSFGAGMVLAPALILALEIFAVIALLVFAGLFLSTRPDLLQDITQMAEQLSRSNLTPERIGRTVEPYLMNPKIGFTVLAFFAGLVPLIEELLKPIGVWLLIGGDMTPAEGFALGLLSGAGYALFENLALSSQAEAWAFAVTARAGTSLLHMLTSALFGWGIVHARRENTYLRLVLTYLTAMLIHGLWNGLSLFALVSTLDIPSSNVIFTLIQPLGRIAPAGLIALTLMSFAILASGNYLLREKLPSADRPAVPPKPAISADLTSEGGSG